MKLFEGNFQSRGFAVELPREAIEAALPRQLALARHHGDRVPLYFLAGEQAIGPSGFPLAERYSEAIFAVPGVVLRQAPQGERYVWMPLLYVNRLLPIVVNAIYGFPKRLARFTWSDGALEIHEPLSSLPRVRLQWQDSERGAALSSHQRLSDAAWQDPAINFILGVPLAARMQFVPGEMLVPSRIHAAFQVPALPFLPAEVTVPAIEPETLGGFRTVQDYSFGLAQPVSSDAPGGEVPTPVPRTGPPRKIAILGGGVGAVTAAFALTSLPNWQQRYQVTVYQQGWRLGGKGASGRNGDAGQRIEEHGLHVWAGFYDNAFRCFQQCYAALEQAGIDGVFASWREAFTQQSLVVQHEHLNGAWCPITTHWPSNDAVPGSGREALSDADYVHMLLAFLGRSFQQPPKALGQQTLALAEEPLAGHPALDWLTSLDSVMPAPLVSGPGETVLHDVTDTALHLAERLLGGARALDADAPLQAHPQLPVWLRDLLERFQTRLDAMFEDDLKDHEQLYAWYLLMSVGVATARGMIEENVFERGFDALDELDLRAFLERYGAPRLVLESSVLRGAYDYVFGYQDGDVARPRLAAGVGLRGAIRVFLTYKGSIMWKMNAGMGDTIFTPYYKLLRHRGVRFEFFSKVTNLGVGGDRIVAIDIDRQAALKDRARGYDPLRRVGALDCWPDRPDWDQLVDGDALAAAKVNFESAWCDRPAAQKLTLKVGTDFDDVILGIPPAAFPVIAPELDRQPRWKAMTDHMYAVQTLAMQLWLQPALPELGWPYGATISTSYVEAWSTWADMSHLLPAEDWPTDAPRNIAYFCGVLADAPSAEFGRRDFPERQLARVKESADAWLDANIDYLWPRAVRPDGRFNAALMRSSYYRANIDPGDRYVLSLPGTTRYRLRADESGFANLALAGDWTRTSINAGCVEAATMSGLRAAAGISGEYVRIDDDVDPRGDVVSAELAEQVAPAVG